MFINFFYKLKDVGIPVSPTSFLTLHRALNTHLITSVDDLYTASRSILVKSERYFDLFDQVFAFHFQGMELPDLEGVDIDEAMKALLDQWLKDPKALADALGMDEKDIINLAPEKLLDYFMKRLKDQTERHDGGNKWIGTGGISPVGHSGRNPSGMRVGGESQNKSAVKLALERRYKDYSHEGPLTAPMIGEAMKRLRHLKPVGPRDQINIDETIYETTRNGGEINIVFDQDMRDRLKVILAIDNGGWSMDPYIPVVQTLFNYARAQFKDLRTYFFHNTIYDNVWEDPRRTRKPVRMDRLLRRDPDTRVIIVGDASMAPYELTARDGSIYSTDRSIIPSIERLIAIADTFSHSVWLNPIPPRQWYYTHTIEVIANIFPMFELSLDGLEGAVTHLMKKFN